MALAPNKLVPIIDPTRAVGHARENGFSVMKFAQPVRNAPLVELRAKGMRSAYAGEQALRREADSLALRNR